MLGLSELPSGGWPRFVRKYGEAAKFLKGAFERYMKDVKQKTYPGKDENY
jgi:ketopantoate hydroxymethyltransferase